MTTLTSPFVNDGSGFFKWLRNLLRTGAQKVTPETETKAPRDEGATIPPAFL